jgi:hypothetical protein
MIAITVFLEAIIDWQKVLVQPIASCSLIDLVYNPRQNLLKNINQNSVISIELNDHCRVYILVILGKKYWLFTSVLVI